MLQIDAKYNVRQLIFSITWYKTVTYRVYANNTIELERVISFRLARESFSATASND